MSQSHGPNMEEKPGATSLSISESPTSELHKKRRPSSALEEYETESIETIDDEHSSRPSTSDIGHDEIRTTTSKRGETLTRNMTGMSARTGVSIATTTDPNFEVDFEDDDPSDPHNWPFWYRCAVIFMVSYSTLTVVMYSTSYTAAIPGIRSAFGISSTTIPVLGITTYMCGLATGSLILAPLSEMWFGRRPVYLICMAMFCILTIPCALADNLEAILVTRFFGALAGSALIANSPGTVNDIVMEEHRALAFSIWSIGPMNGPVVGPIAGGFVFQYMGWRWTNWLICILSGVGFIFLCLIKETYTPTILRQKAAKKRKETGDESWWCRYDEKAEFWALLRINLSRPFVMTVKEPICIFWNSYIALVYAILYLCFVSYSIVFSQLRGWSPGITGLAYVGCKSARASVSELSIGTGSLLCIAAEPLIRKMINAHAPDPATGRPPPEAMVSIVCIAAICVPIGEMIFAWTCTPNVHWIAPILAGIPFGFGNCGVFIYASNYLVHSYGIYAASALAGNGVFRSLLGGTLPLAGPAMYSALGPNWAGTLLSLLEFACIPIPFVFYRYGHRIRMRSTMIRQMQEDKDRIEAKKRKNEARMARRGLRSEEKIEVDVYGNELKRVVSRAERELVV